MNRPEVTAALHPLDLVRVGRWTRALFGTFTLSLGFFEATPLRALRRSGVHEIAILADLSGVAAALGEAGAREVGRTYSVEPVLVKDGCFHPKFMLLDGAAGPRLVIGSGNLTFSGWGRNLELAEILSPEQAPAAFADMADFLSSLAESDRVDFHGRRLAMSWAAALRRVAPAQDEAKLRLIHNVGRAIAPQLVELAAAHGGAEALLVASPYYGKGKAVRQLAKALGVDRIDVHVSTELALAGQHYDFDEDPAAQPVVVKSLDETPRQRPMHAKLLEIQCRDSVLTLSGSVNASGPALSRAGNIELAVVRVGTAVAPRRRFRGPLPPILSGPATSEAATTPVLRATLAGRTLSGAVLGKHAEGHWNGRLDAIGSMRELGDVQVLRDGAFTIQIQAADAVSFGTRRAVLALSRADERISGFVAFPDLLELNRRFGTGAGAMLRVIGGSTEDEDWAGVLEYYARHPDETATAWARTGSAGNDGQQRTDEDDLLLSDLDIRARSDPAAPPDMHGGSSMLSRLAAAARRALLSAPAGAGRDGPGDGEEGGARDERSPARQERIEKIFETLCELLAERVPLDPPTELHRLAELGICVLARRPDAARLAEFVGWWCELAADNLRCPDDHPELLRLTIAFLLLDGHLNGLPQRARHRLAAIIGNVEAALPGWRESLPAPLAGLIEEASAGSSALERFAERVMAERSPLEDLPALLTAIRAGQAPPALARLDREPEMARLRRSIAKGHASRVPLAGASDACCPDCRIGLPESDLSRLQAIGLVEARNCCGRVIVLDPGQP